MTKRVTSGFVIALAILVTVSCNATSSSDPTASQPSTFDRTIAIGMAQNTISGDQPSKALAKTVTGQVRTEVLQSVREVAEEIGVEAERSVALYATREHPYGGLNLALVRLLGFLLNLGLATLSVALPTAGILGVISTVKRFGR